MSLIEINNVEKAFTIDDTCIKILSEITFKINKGEFVCIMGKSGSGKTSLLQLIGGLDTPTSGTIKIGDEEISSLREKKLALFRRKKVGFIFQHYNLIPTLNAVENVALPLLLSNYKYNDATLRSIEILDIVGLEGKDKYYPSQLSGGQQQRVAIARAFSNKPDIILADEPTGALDSENSKNIISILKDACEYFQQTAIIVTHDPFVAVHADRIIFLQDGKIVYEIQGITENEDQHIMKKIEKIQEIMNSKLVTEVTSYDLDC
ncbi:MULTISPECIES: ABC transporter ATP-binding protein [Lysinibacillus]|uniref:ABC transporter ATP-binding protein n=1 Tax=Lysinibacillus TaxID=400634 RepID=UPI00257F5B8B|nr:MULTISPECIES: ABC transporter ATP-binding protein [Lysinibacillus]